MIGKSPFGLLGEDQLVIDEDVEDASSALDELGVLACLLLDGGRQTGGPRKIISGRAIRDRDLHRSTLLGNRLPKIGALGTPSIV